MKDTWNMTPDEAKKYILQNWFDGDENVNAFVCGDKEYTAMAIAVEALEATRWHYPSKGDYPTGGWVLVALEIGIDRRRCVVIGEYHATLTSPEKKWWVHGKEEHHVIAWMPLPEPPKENA